MAFSCTTLWNNEGRSDKVYQVVVAPHEAGGAGMWDIYALYGKRGRGLMLDEKASGVLLDTANAMRDNLVQEKLARGYRLSPQAAPVPPEDYLRRIREEQAARQRPVHPVPVPAAPPPRAPVPAPAAHVPAVPPADDTPREKLMRMLDELGCAQTSWPLDAQGRMPDSLAVTPPRAFQKRAEVEAEPEKSGNTVSDKWWELLHYACADGSVRAWDMWGKPAPVEMWKVEFLRQVERNQGGPIGFFGLIESSNTMGRHVLQTRILVPRCLAGRDATNVSIADMWRVCVVLEQLMACPGGPSVRFIPERARLSTAWNKGHIISAKHSPKTATMVMDALGQPLLARPPLEGRQFPEP